MNTYLKILALASFALAISPAALAHRSGCHAAHSCPSDTGSYVCGDKGNNSQCGGNVAPTSAPSSPKKSESAPRAKSDKPKRPARPTETVANPF